MFLTQLVLPYIYPNGESLQNSNHERALENGKNQTKNQKRSIIVVSPQTKKFFLDVEIPTGMTGVSSKSPGQSSGHTRTYNAKNGIFSWPQR